jgi:hypothetical protein
MLFAIQLSGSLTTMILIISFFRQWNNIPLPYFFRFDCTGRIKLPAPFQIFAPLDYFIPPFVCHIHCHLYHFNIAAKQLCIRWIPVSSWLYRFLFLRRSNK